MSIPRMCYAGMCVAVAILAVTFSSNYIQAQQITPATAVAPEAPITVAIMPSEPMAMFFPIDDPGLLAGCEQVLTDAIQGDHGIRLVDRTNLSHILTERKLALMGYVKTGGGPIISADVFVLSQTRSLNGKSFLLVQAVHAPTATLLSEIKLDVVDKDVKTLARTLDQTVRRWWPTVVKRLEDVRSKPVWVLPDVQIGSHELWNIGVQVEDGLHAGLAGDQRVFCIQPADLTDAQLEMLLKLTGIGRPALLPYTAAADYVLDVRLNSSNELLLCVRDGRSMDIVAQTTIQDSDAARLLAAAGQWVRDQAERLPKPAGGHSQKADDHYDQWARQQARVELEQGKLVYDECFHYRYPGNGPKPDATKEGKEIVENYRQRFNRHFRRAAQLDPTSEEAAYQAAKSWNGSFSPSARSTAIKRTCMYSELVVTLRGGLSSNSPSRCITRKYWSRRLLTVTRSIM